MHTDIVVVISVCRHVASASSGGSISDLPIAAFLSACRLGLGPQHDALQDLLAHAPPNDTPDPAAPASCLPTANTSNPIPKPAAEALLLTAARVRTFAQQRHLTNASGFFFAREDRLFLVTSRHVVVDDPSQYHPDRLDIELHIDRDNLGASTWFSLALYERGMSLWRQASDSGGEIDVAILEVPKNRLPRTAIFDAFGPEHLPAANATMPIGSSVLIVGFPLGFRDSLHHLPVVRQGISLLRSACGFRAKAALLPMREPTAAQAARPS
jgi:hypothetical protein